MIFRFRTNSDLVFIGSISILLVSLEITNVSMYEQKYDHLQGKLSQAMSVYRPPTQLRYNSHKTLIVDTCACMFMKYCLQYDK